MRDDDATTGRPLSAAEAAALAALRRERTPPPEVEERVMDALRAAQIETVGLITERPGGNQDSGGGR